VIVETIDIYQVKSNPNNPRVIKDDKFEKLVRSIKEFPKMLEIRPIVVNDDMIVLGGNMRLKACKAAGLTHVPIIKASDLTEEEQRQFIIKDNVSGGEWDWDMLANEWDVEELQEWGLDVPNYGETELEAVEDDFDATPPEEPITVLGDLYEIGEHRLLCGDSTDSDQVAKLMNGEKADLGHNDPPYGMKKEKDGILNDNLNFSDLLNFNREWISLQFSHLKENGSWYCWGIDEPLMDIYSEILKPYIAQQKATFRNLITWNKGGFGSGGGTGVGQAIQRSYFTGDEKCLFVMMGVQGFNNNADNYFVGFEKIRQYLVAEKEKSGLKNDQITKLTATTHTHYWSRSQWAFPTREHYQAIQKAANNDAFKKEYDAFKKEYDELKKEWYSTRAYFENTHDMMTNVWEFKRERNHDAVGHATPKPIALCERAVKSSCPENGLVADFFLGSGSTMVAAHQLKRKCYGMELDPKYCDVIVRRMLKHDPTLQIKRNGQPIDKQSWHTIE
jgi:DNA modification methylase